MRSAFAVLFFVFLCHTPAAAEKETHRSAYQPRKDEQRQIVIESIDEAGSRRVRIASPGGNGFLVDELVSPEISGATPSLTFDDLDGDGYLDVVSPIWEGATGNAGYVVRLFDPHTRRLTLATKKRSLGVSEEFLNPKWISSSRWLHERAHGGHAGYIFNEYCSRWKGSVSVTKLLIESINLPLQKDEEEVRYRLRFTALDDSGRRSQRQMILSREMLAERFFSPQSRNDRCTKWMDTFRLLRRPHD